MAINNQSHLFNIDFDGLEAISEELGATETQMIAAYNRAINRTGVTLRKMVAKEIADSIKAKKIMLIRKRLAQFKKKKGKFTELNMWFGLNDIHVSAVKGTLRRLGTKKKPKGAMFTAAIGQVVNSKNSFIGRIPDRRSMFHRVGKKSNPIDEDVLLIESRLNDEIEDDIFPQIQDIFMHHFMQDLRGRVRMNL